MSSTEATATAMGVSCRGLRFTWPGVGDGPPFVLAVDDLDVACGEALALVGPSGAGKSTLLGLLAGSLQPAAGTISVAGAALDTLDGRALRAHRLRHVGELQQDAPLVPYLTAAENVGLPLRLLGRDRAPASDLLAVLGLSGRAHHRPAALSVGERRRVALAQALVQRPRVVLADEPLAGLDAGSADRVLALLLDSEWTRGSAVVVVSHRSEVLARVTRRQAVGGSP